MDQKRERPKAIHHNEKGDLHLQDVLQTVMDGFWIVDLKGKFIEVNEVASKMVGYTRKEMLKLNISDLELVETAKQTKIHLQKLFKIGEDRFETKHRCKNGQSIDVELSVKFQSDQNLIVAFVRDITDQKQAEEALVESEKKFRTLFETMSEGIVYEDHEGNIISANPAAERLLGLSLDQLQGRTSLDPRWKSIHEDGSPFPGESHSLNVAAKTGKPSFGEIMGIYNPKLDSYIWLSVNSTPEFMPGEKMPYRAFAVFRDVTERRKSEEALKLSEEQYRLLFKNHTAGFAIHDILVNSEGHPSDYRFLEINPAFEAITGLKATEIIGKTALEVMPNIEPFWIETYGEVAFKGKSINFENYNQDLNKHFQVNAYSPGFGKFATVFLDITEQKQAEQALLNSRVSLQESLEVSNRARQTLLSVLEDQRVAEREIQKLNSELEQRVIQRTAQLEAVNKELETFTYSVSHDLKAPLRGIDGYSKLLLDIHSKNLNDEAKDFLLNIRSSTMQMNNLIEDLLEYSRLERSAIRNEKVKLIELIDSITSFFKNDLNSGNFELKLDVPDVELMTDEKGLTIILRNILENAIKFTKEKPNPSIEIGFTDKPSSWIIRVKDNGIGFDMKYHGRIFEIFQRLHRAEDYAGTGIGLAMVSKGVQRLNGKVWAESIPGEGSIFYFEIPKVHTNATSP